MEKQPTERTITLSIALISTLITIITLIIKTPKFEFYAQFGIRLLILIIPTFPLEKNLKFFHFLTASVLLLALNTLQKYFILGSIFFAFLAIINASNVVSQTAISLFAGFVTFTRFSESAELQFASVFAVIFSVGFGDFGACLMGILSQLQGQERVISMLASGVVAGVVTVLMKWKIEKQAEIEEVERVKVEEAKGVKMACFGCFSVCLIIFLIENDQF